MEKNTMWAIILSTLIIVAYMIVQPILFPMPEAPVPENPVVTENIKTEENLINESKKALVDFVEDTSLQEQTYTITTDYAKVIFTNKGGNIISYELLQHKDGNNFIQMADSITDKNRAFSIALGDNYNEIINSIF